MGQDSSKVRVLVVPGITRSKRIFLIVALVAAIILAVLLWPNNNLPFDFLKGFRHIRSTQVGDFQSHVFRTDGDFDAFCTTAAKELTSKGWRKIERYKRQERWEDGHQSMLIIYEAVYDVQEDPKYGKMGVVDWQPNKLSIEYSFRDEPIWKQLLRKLGL